MKMLVTGGAGFIGSHVADRLIADGHEVVVVDNLSTGMRENVNPRAKFYQMDLVDPRLRDVFERERPEVINHHAAHANVTKSMAQPAVDATCNILGSLNLYDCARAVGVRKIVYASTGGALYGNQERVPVDETHPIELLSNYAVSKYAAELYLRCYACNYGLTYTVLRYANVYGPRQQPHGESGVVAIFATIMLEGGRPKIFGDGTKTRDYVYVSDIAEANALAVHRADNESLNIGTGTETRDFQVFDTVRRAVGAQVEPIYAPKRPGEVQRSALSSAKARRLLLWNPKVSFEAGVAATVPYYRQRYGKPAHT
jgi:UDP-glucose 4-epimerase